MKRSFHVSDLGVMLTIIPILRVGDIRYFVAYIDGKGCCTGTSHEFATEKEAKNFRIRLLRVHQKLAAETERRRRRRKHAQTQGTN